MKRICECCKKEYDWEEGQSNWGKTGLKNGKGSVNSKKYCCYKCGKLAYKEHCEKTNLERYGVKNPFQAEIFKEKSKQTLIRKFGVDNSMKLKQTQLKSQKTCLEHFGKPFSAQVKSCQDKRKNTCEIKYNGIAPACDPKVVEKGKKTCQERYGVDNPMKLKENVEKVKITCIKRHGADHILKTTKGKRKLRKTCCKKYGAPSNLCIYTGIKPRNSSKKEIRWIKSLNIKTMINHYVIKVQKRKFFITDGYDPETNTIYEFLGDYWHGNLELYKPNEINKTAHKRMKTLNKHTFDRFDILKSMGYHIIYIWENDYKQQKSPIKYC